MASLNVIHILHQDAFHPSDLCVGVQQLRTVADDTVVLLIGSLKEAYVGRWKKRGGQTLLRGEKFGMRTGRNPGTSTKVTIGKLNASQKRTKRAALMDELMSRHPASSCGLLLCRKRSNNYDRYQICHDSGKD
jgi:hypothetical protein